MLLQKPLKSAKKHGFGFSFFVSIRLLFKLLNKFIKIREESLILNSPKFLVFS